MKFAFMHNTLAQLTEKFSLSIFDHSDMKEYAEQALNITAKWHLRECPLKALFVLWFVVLMSIYRYKSIAHITKHLIMILRETEPNLHNRAITPEAVMHARKRLGVEPLKTAFELMGSHFTETPSFHGLRTWAADGVDFTLPDTKANEQAFSRPASRNSPAAFPQMQAVALVSVTTHLIRDCHFTPYNTSEHNVCEILLRSLGPGDLLLADRGFPSVPLFEKLCRQGIHFVFRIGAHWKPHIIAKLGPGDYLVRLTKKVNIPQKRGTRQHARRTINLQLRMIEYRVDKEESIRLITSLTDHRDIPAIEIAHLYNSRWDCELSYDEIKTHMLTVKQGILDTDFRSKTPDGVLQEAYGMLIAYNLIRILMVDAAERHHISPLHISFVDTLQVVESSLPIFERAQPEQFDFLIKRLLDDIAACRLTRPRRIRSYPRRVRVKVSSYLLKKPSDKQSKRNHKEELVLVG
ncbi:MAG: IS4 family transposase [Candidatus Xenobiia bacterium LiM19]